VKAGGSACPIRFQCAGCGFYRPDPSYLPALEQHIAALRADRETAAAIGAADYVIDNLTAQIRAFTDVADTMRRRLDALPPGERDDVEHASKILRRARGARQLPLINTASTTGAAG
jgi:primosomal protein N''